MGSKRVNHFDKFIEKGLTPLEPILGDKQKVSCIDADGYKYFLSYHGGVADKRTKEFDKWSKNNPYKAYNMRHFVETNYPYVQILSDDTVLENSTSEKVEFTCPICGKPYKKRWCHWLTQGDTQKNCQDCNLKKSQYSELTENWLRENNIPYIREYRFKDCKYKNQLPFDFKIEWRNKIVLIEVDGQQHFVQRANRENLEDIQIRDGIKTKFCEDNGYLLVRLPWWDFNSDDYKNKLNETFFG